MKVGILTFPNSPSYGASLQMHALYKTIEKFGCEVEIINYMNSYMKNRCHINKNQKRTFRKIISWAFDAPRRKMFSKFERPLNLFPKKIIIDKMQLRDIAKRYDYIIVGSDQVWNPQITGNDLSYFLDFCENNEKKIAYAPSFGFSQLLEENKNDYCINLKKFKSLSIRETAGQQIIEDLLGESCPVVLDPTMLINKGEWEKETERKKHIPKNYIASFIFNNNERIKKFTEDLSLIKKLPVLKLSGHAFSRIKDKSVTGSLGPREWLYVLKNADYIITDSFHGTAFSIIFEKEFFVSLGTKTNSRLITLLDTFDLLNRSCLDINMNNILSINYLKVREVLRKRQNESLEYLKKSLGDIH